MRAFVDLHLHIDGSISLENARQLASLQQIAIPDSEDVLRSLLQVRDGCCDLNEFLGKFSFPCSLLQTKEGLKKATETLLKELHAQQVSYAELRFAPQKHTDTLCQKQVIEAVLEGMAKSPIPSALILCCMRDKGNEEENLETVSLAKEFQGKGVVAIDLAGAEALYKTNEFGYIFEKARKENISFTIHAGEADGPQSIWDAINFGATRIGHGIRAIEDPVLMEELAKRKIPLELCPTSNVCTGLYKDLRDYPLRAFLDKGIVVTINTDDMSVCGTTLSLEFEKLKEALQLTGEEIAVLQENAQKAAFSKE